VVDSRITVVGNGTFRRDVDAVDNASADIQHRCFVQHQARPACGGKFDHHGLLGELSAP